LLEELKGHFVIKPDTPSLMNIFFPEWCVADEEFTISKGYQCPVWYKKNASTKRKESTVNAISVGGNISGRHYEVMMADDVVSNDNATSVEQCAKIAKDFSINRKTLRPWGYVYKIGTRYLDDDMYGLDIEKLNVGDVIVTTDGPCVEILTNSALKTSFLIGRAIVIKPDVKKRLEDEGKSSSYAEAGPDGCDLLIPKILDYSKLLLEWRDDEFVMEGQYNQNPRIQTATTFDLASLQRATIPVNEMPLRGPISQTWDFAFSPRKQRDYCTCATVIWDDRGGMVVIDLVRQRFTPLDLAKMVVAQARKWRPFVIGVENAAGSQMLEPTIIAEALKTGDPSTISVCSKIDWIKVTNEEGAKQTRMASLHPFLANQQLKFVAHLPYLRELYTEFQKCLLQKQTKNDIPDVISRQIKYAPRMARAMAITGLPGSSMANLPQSTPYPTTKAQAEYNLMYGPWISTNEMPADAFGRLGMGEIPRPLVEETPVENERLEPKTPYGPEADPILGFFG
jgi:phage terminase large subunit-like protein